MKVEIFDECVEKKKEEEPLRLRLERCGSSVRIIAVNKKGVKLSGGNLLRFTEEGNLILSRGIGHGVHVQTDGSGKIKIV